MGAGIHGGFGKTSGSINSVSNNQKGSVLGDNGSMPNHEKAITPRDKFINYSLDRNNPNAKGKAEAYERGLGYTQKNADGLIRQVSEYVVAGNEPYSTTVSEYGTKYKFRIPVTGPNGKTKNVIAVYQIDKGDSIPRMITNYLEGK